MKTIQQLVMLALFAVAMPLAARAVSTMVLNTNDSGTDSLRNIVANAPANATITFTASLSGQTILLTSGQIILSNNVTIDGSVLTNPIQINGNHASRIFSISNGVTAVLDSLMITNGLGDLSGGGGINNWGVLTVNDSTLAGNSASGAGGGVYNTGEMTVFNRCTFAGNSGPGGGGIFNGGPATLNNCTLVGNSAPGNNAGGIYNLATLTLNNCTVTGNSAGGTGGGINNLASVYITNCIVCSNTAAGGSPNIAGSSYAGVNLVGTNALLAPLGNYGGPTPTMPPLTGSPAIDAGDDSVTNLFATDQRGAGFPRLLGNHVDIGAVETTPPPKPGVVTLSAINLTDSAGTLTATVNPSNSAAIYFFQYGTTTNYGSVTAVNNLPAGSSNILVNAGVSGLQPNTLYHFRAVAANNGGTNYGGDQIALLASCYSPPSASGQILPATLPDLHLATAGTVHAIVMQPDGKIIIGGLFDSVNGVPRFNLARLNPGGDVDMTWNPTNIIYNIYALALDGTNLYIGGNLFISAPYHFALARVSTLTGLIDPTWSSPGPDDEIRALAVDDTGIYVGGAFTSIGGLARNHIARLSKTGTGAPDPTWNPTASGTVYAILPNNTNVFVGGAFTNIGGQNLTGVARLSTANGTADSLWNPGLKQVTDYYSRVDALALDGTNLFVGGGFQGVGTNLNQKFVAKVGATGAGSVFYDWTPNPDDLVESLAVINGSVYIGGVFKQLNGVNPIVARTGLAKVSAASGAAPDTNWNPVLNFSSGQAYFMDAILATDSGVFVGGNFTTVDDAVSLGIVRLDPVTGMRDTAFPAQVQFPASIKAAVQQPDGKFILGGDIWSANGLPRQNVVRVNHDGSLDSTWRPTVNGTVNALALDGTNLFIGGTFTKVSGVTNNLIAKLTTLSIDAVNVVDTNWNAQAGVPATSDYRKVAALAVTGGNLFVGGYFEAMGGASRRNLAKLSTTGSGTADPTWDPGSDSPPSAEFALLPSGTNLFVGGNFSTIGGVARNCLAKLSTLGTGVVDPVWNPNVTFAGSSPSVRSLALDGTNLFAGGLFNIVGAVPRLSLAKISARDTGAADTNWNPGINPVSGGYFDVLCVAVGGTNVYFGGTFLQFSNSAGLFYRNYLARASSSGIGTVDPAWNPGADGYPRVFLPSGNSVYAGGDFYRIGGQLVGGLERDGFALLPSPAAPVLYQDASLTNLFIVPNSSDGSGISHFYVSAIFGGQLFHRDGTSINCGDFISASEAGNGLPFSLGGTITIAPAVNNTLAGVAVASASYTMITNPVALVALSADSYTVTEGDGSVGVTVKKYGVGPALVDYATADITAAGGMRYLPASGRLAFAAADTSKTIFIPIADDFIAEPPETFSFTLTAVSGATNSQLITPARAVVTINDNDLAGSTASLLTNQAAGAVPVANGVLVVNLQPTNALGQWRLVGQLNWQNSGAQVSGLVSGNYVLEFRPVNGYYQPNNITEPVSGTSTNQFTFYYAPATNLDTGNLTAVIEPSDVATNADVNARGQWQLQGTPTWHNSGEMVPGLNAGSYTVLYKSVAGKLTPTPQSVQVGGGNAIYGYTATYLVAPVLPGALTPAVVPFGMATTNVPYLYNGQLQTSVGFASGVVVKPRVVLTVAHAVFDDQLLAYVTTANWFFERYRDQLEPVPQVPRGWYILDGYATQRALDNSPDISTPASQNLDAAALYFLQDAGRGGYGGYLSANPSQSELLTDNNKMLAGYPLDGVDPTNQGKLFATTPADVSFTQPYPSLYPGVFATTGIQSYPGNSGGPVYVQDYDGVYYPAGIYLGGSGETLVRGIDSGIVDLINRADTAGNGGGNSTGGGVTQLSSGLTAPPFGAGLLTVTVTPNLPNFNPGWRVSGYSDTNYITGISTTASLVGGGGYPVEFKPVPGFVTPSNRTVQVVVGQTTTIQASYAPVQPLLSFNMQKQLNFTGATGATYRVEFSTNLMRANWTPVVTQTLSSGTITLTNLGPFTGAAGYYRTVLLPSN